MLDIKVALLILTSHAKHTCVRQNKYLYYGAVSIAVSVNCPHLQYVEVVANELTILQQYPIVKYFFCLDVISFCISPFYPVHEGTFIQKAI